MFKISGKTNKKGIFYLFLMVTVIILLVTMISSVSATTYTISTNNSTSSITAFLNDADSEDPSPLANGDTVIFNKGKYNFDLDVNKAITLKANGKVIVKNIFISKKTNVSGFTITENLQAGKSNTITNNTIKGRLYVSGANNIIKNNKIFESSIDGGKNIISSNTFKNHVYIYDNYNKIKGNKVANNYKIHIYGKKNTIKNNKQSYRDLTLINVGKTSKGHVLAVKNKGTKSSLYSYIKIYNYDKCVYTIKVPPLKKGKSTKIIIPKKIINKLKYRYYETVYYGGSIVLDEKNKNKDVVLENNYLRVGSDKKGYTIYFSMM
jgi:hypothetical protein